MVEASRSSDSFFIGAPLCLYVCFVSVSNNLLAFYVSCAADMIKDCDEMSTGERDLSGIRKGGNCWLG